MPVDVLIGLQWGDEGKGKIVDYLAPRYDVVARFQGGPNAGHTLVVNNRKIVMHTVPSGILQENVVNLIGNGVVINPMTLKKELSLLRSMGIDFKSRLLIAEKAHLILPTHKILDEASEKAKGKEKIGSTLRGIGPCYADKTSRNGLRVGDVFSSNLKEKYRTLKEKHLRLLSLYDYEFDIDKEEAEWFESLETIRELNIVNSAYYLHEAILQNKNVMAEGAQGTMLDVDFGTYPFVTSSNTISSSACKGLGVSPKVIREVIGISKVYCTRVGSGSFPTELFNKEGDDLRNYGSEFGATTGRPRRCGWIDLVALKYATMINGVTQLVLTKSDVLDSFEQIKSCSQYVVGNKKTREFPYDSEVADLKPVYTVHKGWKSDIPLTSRKKDLPLVFKEYIDFIEKYLSTKVSMISTGPEREKLLHYSDALLLV